MAGGNCRPDSGVYNAVVGTLWSTGILAAQAKAVAVFKTAVHAGHFRLSVHTSPDASALLSSGYYMTALISELHAAALSGLLCRFAIPLTALSRMGTLFALTCNLHLRIACSLFVFPQHLSSSTTRRRDSDSPLCLLTGLVEWGMHAHTAGAAAVCLQRWLLELNGRLGAEVNFNL